MQLSPEFLYLFSYALVILMKIVCFIISYKIVKLGYVLVQSGVKGEFKFSSNFAGFKADLASVSPGLLFVLLGVLFMVVAITVNKTITYRNEGIAPTQYVPGIKNNGNEVLPDSSDFRNQFKKDSTKPKQP